MRLPAKREINISPSREKSLRRAGGIAGSRRAEEDRVEGGRQDSRDGAGVKNPSGGRRESREGDGREWEGSRSRRRRDRRVGKETGGPRRETGAGEGGTGERGERREGH
ncbi:hypothetical protein ACLOJK_038518 [Asimina triloba]